MQVKGASYKSQDHPSANTKIEQENSIQNRSRPSNQSDDNSSISEEAKDQEVSPDSDQENQDSSKKASESKLSESNNNDKRRRRDRDQMILAYKIEYLMYLIDAKKIIRKSLRAKQPNGPELTREEEWNEAMGKYNKLMATLKGEVQCKTILLKKICKLGQSLKQRNTVKNEAESGSISHKMSQSQKSSEDQSQKQSSLDSLSSFASSEEEKVMESINKQLDSFKDIDQTELENEERICLARLKDTIKIKSQIDKNIEHVLNRPCNFLKGRKRKSTNSPPPKKTFYFDLSQQKSKASKDKQNCKREQSLHSHQQKGTQKVNKNNQKNTQITKNPTKKLKLTHSEAKQENTHHSEIKVRNKQNKQQEEATQKKTNQNKGLPTKSLHFNSNIIAQCIISKPEIFQKEQAPKDLSKQNDKKQAEKISNSQSDDFSESKKYLKFQKYMKQANKQPQQRKKRQSSSSQSHKQDASVQGRNHRRRIVKRSSDSDSQYSKQADKEKMLLERRCRYSRKPY